MGALADKLAAMPPEQREYTLETLARHLDEGGKYDRLSMLFDDHHWMHARHHHSGQVYDGFLADLDLLMNQTIGLAPDEGQVVAYLRQILMRTSINSLAGTYSPLQVELAVDAGLWSANRAVSAAMNMSDPVKKGITLAVLVASQRLSPPANDHVRRELMNILLTVRALNEFREILAALEQDFYFSASEIDALVERLANLRPANEQFAPARLLVAHTPPDVLEPAMQRLALRLGRFELFKLEIETARRLKRRASPAVVEDLLPKLVSEPVFGEALYLVGADLPSHLIEWAAEKIETLKAGSSRRIQAYFGLASALTGQARQDILAKGLEQLSQAGHGVFDFIFYLELLEDPRHSELMQQIMEKLRTEAGQGPEQTPLARMQLKSSDPGTSLPFGTWLPGLIPYLEGNFLEEAAGYLPLLVQSREHVVVALAEKFGSPRSEQLLRSLIRSGTYELDHRDSWVERERFKTFSRLWTLLNPEQTLFLINKQVKIRNRWLDQEFWISTLKPYLVANIQKVSSLYEAPIIQDSSQSLLDLIDKPGEQPEVKTSPTRYDYVRAHQRSTAPAANAPAGQQFDPQVSMQRIRAIDKEMQRVVELRKISADWPEEHLGTFLEVATALQGTMQRAEVIFPWLERVQSEAAKSAIMDAAWATLSDQLQRDPASAPKLANRAAPFLTEPYLLRLSEAAQNLANPIYSAQVIAQVIPFLSDPQPVLQQTRNQLITHLLTKLDQVKAQNRSQVIKHCVEHPLFTHRLLTSEGLAGVRAQVMDITENWQWL